jgi:HPt (histidine-containing phosphotransfer) domain-containing protein
MDPVMTTDVQRRLDALRADYVGKLPDQLHEIESACGRLLAGELSADGIVALRYAVHRIAGSAGSFGLDGLSRHAGEAERRIEAIVASPEAADGLEGDSLREQLTAMRAALPIKE